MCIARFWNHQNDKKFGKVSVKLQTLYTERCIWDYTNTWRKHPSRFLRCYMTYLEYDGIWRAMLFTEHVLSDVFPHLHKNNANAHKLFFTSSQNSTFSLSKLFWFSSTPLCISVWLHDILYSYNCYMSFFRKFVFLKKNIGFIILEMK